MISSLVVNFSNASYLERYDALVLEQEKWDACKGVPTKIDLLNEITKSIYNDTDSANVDCVVENGSFSTAIMVYPYDPNLNYDIGVTHGTFREMSIVEVEVNELVRFSLDNESKTKYPVQTLISFSWYTDVYDEKGILQLKPNLSVINSIVKSSKKIYGTAKVKYKTLRHLRILDITAREEDIENVYQSVVYTNWDGGVKMLEVEPPEGAEEDYSNDVTCTTRALLHMGDDNDDLPMPTADSTYEEVNILYCEQEVITYR